MPIRFACEHCQKRLVVGTRMAGAPSVCPNCAKTIRIPAAPANGATPHGEPANGAASIRKESALAAATSSSPAPALSSSPIAAGTAVGERSAFRLYEEFIVYDELDDAQIAYDDDPTAPPPVPPTTHVFIPRTVIYVQGALLAGVAIVAFILGVMAGGSTRRADSAAAPATPFVLRGRVEYRSASGRMRPDEGAVVVLLPQDARPEAGAKLAADGLHPEDPLPGEDDAAIRSIQELGGDYARTDLEGNYLLHGADRGDYFVLAVSRRGHRSDNDPPRRSDVAQIGRYFTPTLDLLSQKQYRWLALQVRGDETRDVSFD